MHKLHGTYRADRHKGRGDEGNSFGGQPKKPTGLTKEEAKAWKRIVDALPKRVLASCDAMELEVACRWWVKHDELLQLSRENSHDLEVADMLDKRAAKAWGIVDRIFARFGMTPADRVKLRLPKDESSENPLAEFGVVG